MISYETRTGTITITEQFLSKLIGYQVTSCFGVVGMVPSGSKQKILGAFSKTPAYDTGIKVTGNADAVDVELHIVVTYGMNLSAMAQSITEKIKYAVGEIAGINVGKVSVMIDGINE
ncbi:MAG: Asp23/Gls24 family envelope stress response protein [Clostridia bacterium]|nr:Asp23/Gls24 family envelope stress response protein [Clostridia bacterium]MBR4910016.1 Asp23/Gls24 family envelope stress response protein [Clostridia bacterium]